MHKTTHFRVEVNSQVVNLLCIDFQPLQMCTKFQFRVGKKCVSMVTGLPNKYHPSVPCLLQITHKQVYYAGCKKRFEDIIIDIITWNLLSYPPFYLIMILKNLAEHTQFLMLINHKGFSDEMRQWFNKCTVYNTSASGEIKKGQKKQFVKPDKPK